MIEKFNNNSIGYDMLCFNKGKINEDIKCPICLDEICNNIETNLIIKLMPCQHLICNLCFIKLSKFHYECPICKNEIISYISSIGEEYNFIKPEKVINDTEDFLLYTQDDFKNELLIIKNKINNIGKNVSKWNSEYKQIDLEVLNHIKNVYSHAEDLLLINTSENQYDLNKHILFNIQRIIKYIDLFKDGFSNIDSKKENNIYKDIEEYYNNTSNNKQRLNYYNDSLYSIIIPSDFERIKRKKSKNNYNKNKFSKIK